MYKKEIMPTDLLSKQQYQLKYDRYIQKKSSFSKTYQILWITAGTGTINISGNKLSIVSDTVFFIPYNTTYTIEPESIIEIIKIYLPPYPLKLGNIAKNTLVNINNINVKQYLATFIFKYNKRADFDPEVEVQDLIDSILPFIKSTEIGITPVRDTRVLECIEYIEHNHNTRFTVSQIADALHINATYLSTIFKNEVGTTIVKYTNNLRLENAITKICQTRASITQIAYDNGFADVRTLNELIKQKYDLTAMEIRKRFILGQSDNLGDNSYNTIIDKYKLPTENGTIHRLDIIADMDNNLNDYVNSFNCIAIGRAHDILYANVQDQLIRAKHDLNFKYCRFHNIFGDEMNIIDTDLFGNQSFSFSKPFRVIEFLLTNDILPFIEIGFFPRQMTTNVPSPFNGYNINVGGDIDYHQWENLITTFFTSLKNTFPDHYQLMRFDFWNEPDIRVFWPNSNQAFYDLYELTYKTIKAVDPTIQIGGFNYGNFINDTKNIEEDMNYCQARNILPDFLTIHSYPLIIEGELAHNPDKAIAIDHLKPTYVKDKLNLDIAKLNNLKQIYNFKELYITEWNTSPMQREHLNDSTYKSSKIVNEVLNSNSHLIDGICYWTLSDEMAEFGYPNQELHGGFGLFTRSGITKPAYYGLMFASRLTGRIVHKTENSIIIENNKGYNILVNNNVDYDRNYYITNFGNQAQIMEGNVIQAHIKLDNLIPGLYTKKTYAIDYQLNLKKNFDSIANNKSYLKVEDINLLKRMSRLTQTEKLINLATSFETTINVDQTCTTLIVFERH